MMPLDPAEFRPSAWWVAIEPLPHVTLAAIAITAIAAVPLPQSVLGVAIGPVMSVLVWAVVVATALRVAWSVLAWAATTYRVDGHAVERRGGVLRRVTDHARRADVRAVYRVAGVRQRLVGLCNVGVATAATGGIEVVLKHVRPTDPRIEALTRSGEPARALRSNAPVVIGLVGGIGSGKSTVAKAFAELGCLVSDSDAMARAALERPDVIAEVLGWWGDRVLARDGGLDRKAIASIVFNDPDQRRRLEGLIHPLIRRRRDALIGEATDLGAPGVIVDAPLLFEAGLDAECDAVVFVDAPEKHRRRRVVESRGWDAEELARREASQTPLDEKRRRSDHVIANADGVDPAGRVRAARRILEQVQDKRRGGA